MIRAYFDTNVFGDLRTHDKGVTAQDELELRDGVAAGRLSIPFSYLNVEEVVAAPTAARVAEGKLILEIVNCHRVIRPLDIMMVEALRSYAGGGNGAVRIFFRKGERRTIRSGLRALLLGGEMQDLIDRKIAIEECKKQKRDFRDMLRKTRKEVRDQVQQVREGGFMPDFQWVLDQRVESFAEHFARRARCLEACRLRWLSGLLKIPLIRMAIGASISLVYATSFEQRPANPGDSRDVLHATLAAATADVFVTHDEELRDRVLARVNERRLGLASLHELLEQVRSRAAK